MKKRLTQILCMIFAIAIQINVYGQADTVNVPTVYNGDALGAINNFILGDTTATGERKNPDRFYKLERNKIYFLNGEFHANFFLRLIADEADADNKPPIVASTTGADGKPQLIQFKVLDDAYIKNIMFQMTPPGGNGESNASFFLAKEGGNYYFDNVQWEWGLWMQVVAVKPVNKIVVRNCYFRNPQHKTNIYNGRGVGFYLENPSDTVIMVNNTFFNMNSFAFVADQGSTPPKYFLFDHNTIVNEMKWPIHSYWLTNAHVTNNLFYNCHSFGEDSDDKVGQDPDKLIYGIINISSIPSDILASHKLKEEERAYELKNNAYFYSQEIFDYWDSYKEKGVKPEIWMNTRTTAMFANDEDYPNLVEEKTYYMDPHLKEAGTGTVEMVKWMERKRDWKNNKYWGWDPDGDKFAVQWPFPEDLTYTNDTLLTGAQGGFPVGDLNWYPDQKALWEVWEPSGVNDMPYNKNRNLTFENVYPNPFTDEVSINFSLDNSSVVEVDILDITGNKVASLYKGTKGSGHHTVTWNSTKNNAIIQSGLYFYRIKSNGIVLTGKIQYIK